MKLVIRKGEIRAILFVVVGWPIAYFGWGWLEKHTDLGAAFDASFKYGVLIQHVTYYGAKPHDCDFLSAPIGYKHCSYQRAFLAEWIILSPDNQPMGYGTLQEAPPRECSTDLLDFAHRCYVADLLPGERRPTSQWHAQRVEIHWKKVED